MDDSLSWILLPGILLFLLLSVWAYLCLRGELVGEGRSGAESSAGSETRKQFFTLLLLSAGTRFVSLCVDMLAISLTPDADSEAELISDDSNTYAWLSSVVSLLPALFFVSTYSLLILFYAQLCTAAVYTSSFPLHKGIYVVCNLLLYLGFLVLLVLCTTSSMFWQWTQGILGAFYLLGLLAVLYYSLQLILFFKTSHPDDEFFFDMHLHRGLTPRQIVIQRIMWVCVMCCILFCGQSVYLIGISTGLVPSIHHRTPDGVSPYAFEVGQYIATEFLPCALLLLVTRRNPLNENSPHKLRDDLDHTHLLPETSGSNRPDEASYLYQNPPRPYFPRNSSSGVFDRSPVAASSSTKPTFV
ncbi:hypothetical protein H310_11971 [Aphanomyces invadans]|uniref:Uncharacterized protein n=1 Tax=Aphanomyces invadans TaxID=157072 RepID=A0A024TJV0_9STRA|nr:hypothetical protein H310_11971 [Aphanomyces invadans]ETV94323.1 hypothetical protein H310_11971 [Aphanomyces invadans]|eukprot:XP_008877085.1 hypothetical protein H310_11971 [Aphanomyces invadans]